MGSCVEIISVLLVILGMVMYFVVQCHPVEEILYMAMLLLTIELT